MTLILPIGILKYYLPQNSNRYSFQIHNLAIGSLIVSLLNTSSLDLLNREMQTLACIF